MTVMMSDDLYQKIHSFLRVIANADNWRIEEVSDRYGDWIMNDCLWTKDSYDPQYVAQDLLEFLPDEDE